MKKIRDWCLVVLLCLPNMAFAHTHSQTDAVGIRVFNTPSYTSSYVERVEVLSGCPVVGDSIDTDCLAEEAYNFAQSIGALSRVPESNQFRGSYKDLFLRWNDLGSTMSVSRFMRKATGTGFYLPQGRGRSVPLSTVELSEIKGEVDLLQQQMRTLKPESVQSLQVQIDAMTNRLVGIDSSTVRLLGTLTTLKAMVENLPSLSQAELNAQKAELGERLSGLADRVTRVEETKADKADVASIEAKLSTKASQSDVASLAARMSSFENSPSVAAPLLAAQNPDFTSEVKELWLKYWWIPAVILLLGVLVWLLKSRKNTPVTKTVTTVVTPVSDVSSVLRVTEDMDQYETDQYETLRKQIHDPKNGMLARVGQLEDVVSNDKNGVLVRMDQLDKEVTQLRNDCDYLLLVSTDGLRMVGTPDQKTLDALTIGEHIDLLIEGDEGARTVRIVRGTFENENGGIEDRLYVYGVSDVNNGVSVDSVRLSKCLLRALKEWKVTGIDDSRVGLKATAYKRTLQKPTIRRTSATKAA